MPFDGILNVDKPAGWTSFDVVAFVRRRAGVKRVGHAGTLDPAATGVLPVCLGQATRVVEYLVDARKRYRATVRLGVETDTYDADGQIVATAPAEHLRLDDVEHALVPLRGEIEQRPPPFSAIKRAGVPLYRLARAGQTVETSPRRVTIFRLEVLAFEPPLLTLEIECSKGAYVRSLAHDLGAALGVGASLDALVRTRVGPFRIEDAVDIDILRRDFETGEWQERLYALDEVLLDWPAAILGPDNSDRVLHGRPALFEGPDSSVQLSQCRAYSTDGDFLAVLARADGQWRPEKVFSGR